MRLFVRMLQTAAGDIWTRRFSDVQVVCSLQSPAEEVDDVDDDDDVVEEADADDEVAVRGAASNQAAPE